MEVTNIWDIASSLKNSICSFATEHKVPGVRLNATKFLEQIVLTFTDDKVPVLTPGSKNLRPQPMSSVHGVLTPSAVSTNSFYMLRHYVLMLRKR